MSSNEIQTDFALDDASLARETAEAIEDAAISGLCRDGQEEIAASYVRRHRPKWSLEAVAAFVRDLLE
jgi:hypothetical protein